MKRYVGVFFMVLLISVLAIPASYAASDNVDKNIEIVGSAGENPPPPPPEGEGMGPGGEGGPMGPGGECAMGPGLEGAPMGAEGKGGQGMNGDHKKKFEEMMNAKWQQLCKELGISEAQKKSLDENMKNNRTEMMSLGKAMHEKRELMKKEIQNEKLDMDKVVKINGEIKELQSKMADRQLSGILEVRKILTPEQFKKFSEKMEEGKKHFKGGKMMGMGMTGKAKMSKPAAATQESAPTQE
ncbi:MAG TPA: Spy/CpxP family protein refolding chaperone [Candidatus Omnitrophota bacterium]|nr:Spy/CpxP family protein refolding chaperone [Candidatus Omnitrophota bacterium]